MKDENKSKAQLIAELQILRKQLKSHKNSSNKALQKSEDLVRIITEHTTDNIAITTFDLKAKFLYVNPSVKQVLGYEPENLLGKSIFDFIHPDDKKTVFPLLKNYVKQKIKKLLVGKENEINETVEFRFRDKTGHWHFMQSSVNILGNQLLAVTRDITEQKLAEIALRESEEQYRSIVEGLMEGIAIHVDQKVVYVNKALKKLLGYRSDKDVIGKNILEFVHPDDREMVSDLINTGLSSKKDTKNSISQKSEERLIRKDGSIIITEVSAVLISYYGKPALMVMINDITERKQTEKALSKSENNLRTLFNAMTDLVFELDYNGTFLTIAPTSPDLVYKSPGEIIGKTLHEIFPKSQADRFLAFVRNCLDENKSAVIEYPLEIGGKTAWFEGKATPKSDNSILFIARDITERKKMDEALLRSESRYRMLFEQSADAILIIKDNRFVDCNYATVKMLGYANKQELLDTHPSELSPEKQPDGRDSYEKANEMMAIAIEKGSHRFEWDHKRKNGEVFPVEVLLTSISLENENFIHVVWRDITERKEAEKKLLESEKRYRTLVENMPDGVYRSTPEGKFIEVNTALVKMLGYESKKELMKIDISKDLYFAESERKQIIDDLKQFNYEKIVVFRLRHKSGREVWVEDHGRIVHDGNGNILYHEGVLRDVTERKESEEKIAELAEFNKSILTSAPVGIITVNKERKITSANKAFADMMGSPNLDEVLESDIELPIFSDENIKSSFQKALEYGQGFEINKLPFTSQWNKKLIINIKGVPQKGKDGGIFGVVIVVNDVTDSVHAEEENAKLEKQLRHAQKLETIGTLAGGIAHDFNNILAPILGFTELALLKAGNDEGLTRDLNQVLKGTRRAKELVEQILLFSKQSEKERKSIALQSLIREALKLLRPSIPTTIEIKQEINPSCPPVLADATQIHQVIVNLCTNAWQAMENGGELTIKLDQVKVDNETAKLHPNLYPGFYAKLSVADTGIGMNEETIDRIFEPFFTTKSIDKGTGLGLSVVHGIVRNHHGDIFVYSEPGKGSIFHIYLPVVENEQQDRQDIEEELPGGTERVMIVDDEPAVAEMVKNMLENFGYQADIFKSGSEAVETFKRNPNNYDLVISDLTMPHLTGLDLADRLRKEQKNLPIIIMTGFGDTLTKPTLEHYGVGHVINKPISVKELLPAVRKVLDES